MKDFKKIEAKWAKVWEKNDLYKTSKKGDKKYVLVEFPYPSGSGLHIGHAFTFTGGDVYARYWRMKGKNVLFPMGFDAFGLPTENYAIKTKQQPQAVTKNNVATFKKQMKRLGFSFDWSREVNTTDPDYYKWTQWIFIQLFKKGLAYKQEMPINWCPSCKIGLANEEVVDGKCERCGAEVSRRNISQWIVKITEYADRLIEGLEKTDFVEKVKKAQINWIGRSNGARVKFKLSPDSATILQCSPRSGGAFKIGLSSGLEELEVFTTRPDTLWGATFMVVAPEHKLISELLTGDEIFSCSRPSGVNPSDDCARKNLPLRQSIKEYVTSSRKKSDLERTELQKEKTGVFSGLYAINPVNGKEIPIWISDFVLESYGTGAIMAVPAHDERDFAFAKKFGLPVVPVIEPKAGHDFNEAAYTNVDEGRMINSDFINGMRPSEAITKVTEWLEEKGIGKKASSYHLRDWIFSRQHYWGEPIPMVYCQEHGWQPVDEKDLPVVLPEVEHYQPTDTGESPLAKMTDWVKTKCPVCGGPAKRETDTMPNWAGSDWYFLRYIDPINGTDLASKKKMKYWLPVDVYIGGDEHNTLHLLYSRFINNFLFDLGVVPVAEPYDKRISHGVILGPDNQRMSKSRGNVILPETVADKFGVDVLRMYLMFMGPFDATMAWNEKTLMGVKRFLDRFEVFVSKQIKSEGDSNKEVKVIINQLVEGVGRDMESFKYNTAIAKMMEALNNLSIKNYELRIEDIKTLIKLLAPMAPYMAEELWSKLGENKSVHGAGWPEVEEKYRREETITIPVAVNGKVRDELQVSSDKLQDKNKIVAEAKALAKIQQWLEGKELVKEIYVPGKMINLVVK